MRLFLVLAAIVMLSACEREDREYRPDPMVTETHEEIAITTLSPGDTPPVERPSGLGAQYVSNAYHVSQGKKWYTSFNCNGCHSNGGGGSGPPLMDEKWSYGGSVENIVQSIREGRPNGMPSWRGKITDEQIWELAAYVLSMSGNVSSDVANGRNDDLAAKPPENMTSTQPPVNGGQFPKSGKMPQ
jgi:cytochrome c oxidase cbb3-type subunit 3